MSVGGGGGGRGGGRRGIAYAGKLIETHKNLDSVQNGGKTATITKSPKKGSGPVLRQKLIFFFSVALFISCHRQFGA